MNDNGLTCECGAHAMDHTYAAMNFPTGHKRDACREFKSAELVKAREDARLSKKSAENWLDTSERWRVIAETHEAEIATLKAENAKLREENEQLQLVPEEIRQAREEPLDLSKFKKRSDR